MTAGTCDGWGWQVAQTVAGAQYVHFIVYPAVISHDMCLSHGALQSDNVPRVCVWRDGWIHDPILIICHSLIGYWRGSFALTQRKMPTSARERSDQSLCAHQDATFANLRFFLSPTCSSASVRLFLNEMSQGGERRIWRCCARQPISFRFFFIQA